jgi:type IV pilus assembly protein PilW
VTSGAIDLHRRQGPARGISIIELMVGLVLCLLISLAATSSAQLFTASQRQGVSAGGSAANIGTVLASIKSDVASGGLGFFGDATYLCTKLNLSQGATMVVDGGAFAPVRAARVDGNDRLDVVYGSEVAAGASVALSGTSTGTDASLKSLLPATAGQAVLLASQTVGTPCVVRSVTSTTVPTAEARQLLTFAATGEHSAHNQVAFTTKPDYGENSRVSLLGSLQWNRYALNGTNLEVTRVLAGTTATLMRNVIGFRVQYGTSADATTDTLSSWDDAKGAFASIDQTNIARVRALRIGIVVRSPQPEKPNAQTGQCEASSAKPTLFGDTIEPDVANWQCYRYRSTVVIAPLRNIIYGLRSS